ncbi:autotransporter-associated beta strand repeat-containing protein [Hoeflea sp. 108]|uniref:autotransporter-associated beta strand repeat-containing protein n=1 Tax=Hoeflea sp. 108 TaxID=1116369 RepID=UPI0003A5663F|nr:autotransporter-associated beta strand repeat-containing protein [Hoeflea sp. 108]
MSSIRSRRPNAGHDERVAPEPRSQAAGRAAGPSCYGRYRFALLACTALVAPLVLSPAIQSASAQTRGNDGGAGGNGSGTRAGGTGLPAVLAAGGGGGGGGQSGNGQPSGSSGGNGGTSGFGGGGGGAADSGGGGGAGYNGAGGGGGGGGGGAGLVINSGNVTVGQNSSGGIGGKGGYGGVQIGGTSIAGGGGGGGGGSGILVGGTSGAATITVGAGVFVRGGAGGDGTEGNTNGGPGGALRASDMGAGGHGGHGISVTDPNGATIIVNGDVAPGGGGSGGGWGSNKAANGSAGVGIRGQNLDITIGTAGAIRRADNGQDAIYITGGTNRVNSLGTAPNQGTVQGAIHLGAGTTTISGNYSGGTRPTWILVDGGAEMKVEGSTAANDAKAIHDLQNYGLVTLGASRWLSLGAGTNYATINIGSGAKLETTYAEFNNRGTINVADQGIIDAGTGFFNYAGSVLNLNGTATVKSSWGAVTNLGQFNVKNGDVIGAGIFNNDGGTLSLSGGSLSGISELVNRTGATVDIAAGRKLSVGTFTALGGSATGAGTIEASSAFNLDTGSFAAKLGGAAALYKTGTGTATLSGTNDYSGGTVISAGTLAISSDASLGSGDLTFDGGTLQATSTLTTSRNATLGSGGGGLAASAGATLTYNGLLSGAGALTVSGVGKVVFSSANTYLGGTRLIGGTLSILDDSSLGNAAGVLTLQGGTLETRGTTTANRSIVLAGPGGGLAAASGTTLTQAGQITGTGALNVNGAGTLKLTNATNSYSGGTTLSSGTLEIAGDSTLGTGGLTFAGGTLASTTTSTISRAVSLSSSGTITTAADTTLSLSGVLSGAGGLTVGGSGKLALSGTNTYSGGTTLAGGTLSVVADENLGTGALNFNGGTLDVGSSFNMTRSGTIGAGGGTIALGSNSLTSWMGGFSGAGALNVTGTGTLVLAGTNSYTGGTTITGATLQVGNGGAGGALAGAVTNNGKLVVDRAASTMLSGVISGSGGFEQKGTGSTTLAADNTYTGGTKISGGTLQIGQGSTTGWIAGDVENNGRLAFNRSDETTYGGVVSGSGSLVKSQNSKMTLTGANSYTGGTTITGGTLVVGDGATSGTLGSGGIENYGTIAFNRSDVVTIDDVISGDGQFRQEGSGTTVLTGTSTYTGTTSVTSGKLVVNGSIASSSGITVGANGAIGGAGTIGSTYVYGTLSAGNSPGTLTVDGNLTLDASSTSVFELGTSGVAGGPTNDLVIVNGDLTLGGTLETPDAVTGYYRLFNVSGTVTGSFDTLPTDAFISTAVANQVNLLIRNGDQLLQFWDGSDLTGNGTVDGGSGTWNASNGNWTGAPGEANFNDGWRGEVGVFAGTAGTVTVSGTLAFQGLQFATNGYSLTGGILALSGNPYDNEDASFINTDSSVKAVISSVIADGDKTSLDKLGLGTLVLAADNTYTGKTTISAGTLQIGNGGTSGSVAGDIINNSVLAFNRSDDALVFDGYIAGTGRLEQNGTGTTTLTGYNYYTGGTYINAGTLQIGNGGSIKGNVFNNSALVFNDTVANGEFEGDISGTGTVLVTGNSIVVMSGDVSHSGGTTIDSGSVLQIGDTETSGTLSGDVSNSGQLVFDRSDDSSFGGDISGSGDLKKYGAGKLTLSGDSSGFDGIVYMNAGTLRVENSSAAGTGYLMMFGGGLDYGADVDLANTMILQQENTVLSVASGTATHSGYILGGGSEPRAVEKTGDGTLVVKAMQHGGDTVVSEGTLKAGNSGALDLDSAVTVKAGATLDFDGFDQTIGSLAGAGSLTLGAGYLTTGGNDGSTEFSGVISGSGGLSKAGTGVFTLSGANTYTGPTWVDAGRLKAGATNSFSSRSSIDVASGATLDLDGYDQIIGSLTGAGGVALGAGTLTTGGDDSWTNFSGIINGTGGLIKKGTGTFTLSGANAYTGATKVDAGTLRAGAANTIDSASAVSVGSGATFDLNGHNQAIASLAGAGNVKLGSGTLTAGNGNDTEFSGVMSGTGGFTKQGTGKQTMSGDNTYTGDTSVNAGELQVNGKLGGTAVTVDSGATLSGSGTIAGSVTVSDGGHIAPGAGKGTLSVGSLLLRSGANLDFELGEDSDRIDVDGNLTLDGTLNVSGGNDFGAGIYRLINYGGTLVDNGLVIGTVPGAFQASDLSIQTQVASQVNLINTGGTALSFWDGGANANLNNGIIDGGDGTWSAGGGNWTRQDGAYNAAMAPRPGYAIFQGTAGTVTVEDDEGDIAVTGMQFVTSGYTIKGDAIGLADAATTIRVGDGTVASAGTTATIESELTGSGGLVKDDYGTLVLSGANTYAGGTVIKGGTLSISSDANLGAASGGLVFLGGILTNTAEMTTARGIELRLAGGTFDTEDDLTASGVISGQGKLTKTGDGKLILTGANTYEGGTRISAGTLELGGGGTSGSISGAIENNAVLALNRSNLMTLAGAISGSGSVRQVGSGKTVLTGTNTYTGGTTISAGTLSGSATSFGTGTILNDAALIVDQGTNASMANVINGTGTFTKSGTGTLTLTGISLLSGATTVSAGKLAVDGSLAASSVTVEGGAALGGNGTVGKITALSGATVAAGSNLGKLTVKGDASFASGSTFQVDVDTTRSGRLEVEGKATMSGGAVRVLAGSGTYAPSTQYTILTAASGVFGQFASVTTNLAFLTPTLTYTANSVGLSLDRNDIKFSDIALTRNQFATGKATEALDNKHAIYKAMVNLDEDGARRALDSLSGEIHGSVSGMLAEDSRFLANAANDRIRAAFGDVVPAALPVMAYGPGGLELADAATERMAFWSQAYGAWSNISSDGNASGFDSTTGGLIAGADAAFGDNIRLGVFGGYSHSSFDTDALKSNGSSDGYHAGVFAGGQWGAFGLRGGAAYSWNSIDTSRKVAFGGFSDNLTAEYDAATTQVFAEAGYRLERGDAIVEPFANLAYINVRTDGFTEKGGPAALTASASTTETTFATLGVRASRDVVLGDAKATLRGMVGWRHAFGEITPLTSVAFAGGNAFTIAGAPVARDAVVVEAGVDFDLSPAATLGLSYTGQLGGGAVDQSFKADLAVRF